MKKNKRAPEMWRFISSVFSFYKLTVVDYGCGYGDMLIYIANDGADLVAGYEKDQGVLRTLSNRLVKERAVGTIHLYDLDFEQEEKIYDADVALSLSVLPYLEDPYTHLQILARSYGTSFIECQYAGDGPGFENIKNDKDMAEWLKDAGFLEPRAIGKTLAKEKWWRTIWMCQKKTVRTWHHGIGKPSASS